MTINRIRSLVSDTIIKFGSRVNIIRLLKNNPIAYRLLRSFLSAILGKQPLVSEIVAGPLKDYKIVLGTHDRKQFLIGEYEKNIVDFIQQMVVPGMHVLDIGANVGYFSLLFSVLVGDQGLVYAVEPSPTNVEKIGKTIQVNQTNLSNMFLFPFAATDRSGLVDFYIEPTGAMGHIVKDGNKKTVSVKSIRIDDLIRENEIKRIDFVKIDVEGSEKHVLSGMQDLLLRDKPVIICEWHPSMAGPDYKSAFEKSGYQATCINTFSSTKTFHIVAKPI